jgi:hypothetical protein
MVKSGTDGWGIEIGSVGIWLGDGVAAGVGVSVEVDIGVGVGERLFLVWLAHYVVA